MSNEAINWALTQPIKHSTAKFVLVVMANCADGETWEAWPSVAHLAESTGQDRKTVLENIKRLLAMGYIADSGMRKGSTKQVIVYRLNSPEIGATQESQKRNSTVSGTVPNFPGNSPVFPHEESRNSSETVPKTGHGTQRNHQGTVKEPKKEVQAKRRVGDMPLPDWLPADAWASWVDYRSGIKAPLTAHAADLCIAKLDLLRIQGSDPRQVIDQSVMSGKWTGLFPIKRESQGPPGFQTPTEKQKSWADRITGKTRHDQPHKLIDLNAIPP